MRASSFWPASFVRMGAGAAGALLQCKGGSHVQIWVGRGACNNVPLLLHTVAKHSPALHSNLVADAAQVTQAH